MLIFVCIGQLENNITMDQVKVCKKLFITYDDATLNSQVRLLVQPYLNA